MILSTLYSHLKELKSENGWKFYYVEKEDLYGTVDSYIVMTGYDGETYYALAAGSDKTDFDTNHKSTATKVNSFNEGVSKISQEGRIVQVFDSEALVDGVYEDGIVVTCFRSNKTFNIENEHATNGLKYKVWGSPNNSEWEEIISETALAAQTKISVVNNDYWKYIKVSAKGDGGASTINAYIQVGS